MKLDDIITLAKAGYTPKQVKELLDYVEASPKVQEAPAITPDEVPQHNEEPAPQVEPPKAQEKTETAEDILNRLLEDN